MHKPVFISKPYIPSSAHPTSEFVFPHPTYLGSCQRDSMRRLRVLILTPFSPSHTLHTTLHTTIRTPYIHIFFSHPTYLGIYRCDALRCLCVRILTSLSYSPTHYIPKLIPQFANPTSKFVFLHPTYLCVVVSMTAWDAFVFLFWHPFFPPFSHTTHRESHHNSHTLPQNSHSHTLFSFSHTTYRDSHHDSHVLPQNSHFYSL